MLQIYHLCFVQVATLARLSHVGGSDGEIKNETDLDFTPYGIKVTFAGKKTSKNNRKYNAWEIGYNCVE